MKALKRPESVRVGFSVYRVEWLEDKDWPEENKEDGGLCYNGKALIQIRTNPLFDESIMRECLLHEVMHAIWFHNGLATRPPKGNEDDREEIVIGSLSPGILAVVQDNPTLFEYLASA